MLYLVLDALDHAVDLVLHLARDGGELVLDGRQLLVQHALLLHLGRLLVRGRVVHLEYSLHISVIAVNTIIGIGRHRCILYYYLCDTVTLTFYSISSCY